MLIIVRREDDQRTSLEEMQARFGKNFHGFIFQNEPKVFATNPDGTPDEMRTIARMTDQAWLEANAGTMYRGAFATGDPGGSPEQIKTFMLAFKQAWAEPGAKSIRHGYHHWDGQHGYKMTEPESWDYHIGRIYAERQDYLDAGIPAPDELLTEIGQDRMALREVEGRGLVPVGWRAAGAEQFQDDLSEVFRRLSPEPWFIAGCVFCMGTNGDPLWKWTDCADEEMIDFLHTLQETYGKVGLHILEGGPWIREIVQYINPRAIVCTPAAADIAAWAYETFPEEPLISDSPINGGFNMATKEELALAIQDHVNDLKFTLEAQTGALANPILTMIDPALALIIDKAGQIHDLPPA